MMNLWSLIDVLEGNTKSGLVPLTPVSIRSYSAWPRLSGQSLSASNSVYQWPLLGHDSKFGAGKNRGWMPHVLLLFYYLSLWLYLWLSVCTLQRSQNKYTKIRKSQSCRICQKIKIEIWAKNENCESDGDYSE